jgi:Subtilase family
MQYKSLFNQHFVLISLITALCLCQPPSFSTNPKLGTSKNQQLNGPAQAGVKPSQADFLVIQLNKDADREKFDDLLTEVHGKLIRTIVAGPNLEFLVIQTEPGEVDAVEKKFKATKDIAIVERNRTYKTNAVPDDPYFSAQWDLSFMQFSQARTATASIPRKTAEYLIFLDTGATLLGGESARSIMQYDFSNSYDPTGARELVHDSGSHGTETSSVTSSTDNNFGFAGMANFESQRCDITMCRISPDGTNASLVSILSALAWINQNPTLPPEPINCSFESPPPSTLNANPMIQEVAKQLQSRGFLLVLAAGNYGVEDRSPELYAHRVASVGATGLLSHFSVFGPFAYAAPGENVLVYTTNSQTATAFVSGTSFAAPRWCAAIANVMGILSPAYYNAVFAHDIVSATATVTPQGYRIPNLQAALELATRY